MNIKLIKIKKNLKNKNMKEFKDLKFKDKNYGSGKRAYLEFPNKYGVSVITGGGSYSNKDNPYELAVFLDGELCYDTHITNDVMGYLTSEEVTKIMKQIQELDSLD